VHTRAGLVYVCGVFLGMEKLTRSTSANMVVIAVGVAIAAYGEIDFVAVGVAQQLSALAFEALRLMLVQVRIRIAWRGASRRFDSIRLRFVSMHSRPRDLPRHRISRAY
jgi:hypothetical protein